MNKKADLMMSYVIYIILLVMFVGGMLWHIEQKRNGADLWGEFYVKEIVKAIDFSRGRDEIWIDVHKATEIALKNEVGFSEIFRIDNLKNEVCVKLGKGGRKCFNYFNDVDVIYELKLSEGKDEKGESNINLLYLKVVDKQIKELSREGENVS